MASIPIVDDPKCLRDEGQCEVRHSLLRTARMRDLTALVHAIRIEVGSDAVPFFDPLDGGVDAECLFLLEAPGPRAVRSGFVSRNNPDETAKNWYELNEAAGIGRARTLVWNVVPWYIGKESRIRAANSGDIVKGLPYLRRLLELLPKLRVMVLVGRKAGRARVSIQEWAPQIEIFEIPHPSPSFVNRGKHHRQLVLQGLIQVKERLDDLAGVGNGPG